MLEALTQDERDFVDELLFADLTLPAMQFVQVVSHCHLREAIDAVDTRKTTLGIDFNGHTRARVVAFDTLSWLQKTVQGEICVIEGSWDGDSFGWFIRLSAIIERPSARHPRYTDFGLCVVRSLPYQVEYAAALGEELARLAGTMFYLTSVEIDDEKRWWDTQPANMR